LPRTRATRSIPGLPRPERIFQLIIPDLPADFPPLRSLDTSGRARSGLARVLTTALFVDMVGSTERLVALGDRRWQELQAQYSALVRQELAVSVGIHAGEVEYDDRTMSGITVFTCVRITEVAQPGEVLVSNTVKELVAGSSITFTDRGTHVLKGLPGEWRLFSPDVSGASASTS
jgi:class 3 adenylate cyclase